MWICNQRRLNGLFALDAVAAVCVVLSKGLDAFVDGLAEACGLIGHERTIDFARLVYQAPESGIRRLQVPLMIHIETILHLNPVRVDARDFDLLAELISLLRHPPSIIRHQLLVIHLRSTMLFTQGAIQILCIVVVLLLTLIDC